MADALERAYGAAQVWVQGVGGPVSGHTTPNPGRRLTYIDAKYMAAFEDNSLPDGTSPAAIREAQRLFNLAAQRCPISALVAGGYSQGSAVMSGAVTGLSAAVQGRLRGVVLFGYSRNQQNGGRIPGYSTSRTRVYCAADDLVCQGTLTVTPAHFTYVDEAQNQAPAFLRSQIG